MPAKELVWPVALRNDGEPEDAPGVPAVVDAVDFDVAERLAYALARERGFDYAEVCYPPRRAQAW